MWPAIPPSKGIVFNSSKSYVGAKTFLIPCSQCIGCRLDRSRDWATRITHEAQLHGESCFLTLTYDDEHYPESGSVNVREVQLFLKRVRKSIGRVRFFACGEYGDEGGRPHYHVILFGTAFYADRVPWRRTPAGFVTYRSPTLEKLWPYGLSEIGTVSAQSAGYVARYVIKKVTGDAAAEHYQRVHPLTGELVTVRPEFICMSNRPGIGKGWFDQYACDAFPSDFLIIEGARVPVPRYYKKKLAEKDPSASDRVTWTRKARAIKHADNNTPERLAVREELQHLRAERLKRSYEQ